jgi:hypothetical protein
MKAIQEKVAWFLQRKLAWGVTVIVLTQVLGMLPAADFLPPLALKAVSFGLGIVLTCAKGVEMFFDQSAQLAKQQSEETDIEPSATNKSNPDRIV